MYTYIYYNIEYSACNTTDYSVICHSKTTSTECCSICSP